MLYDFFSYPIRAIIISAVIASSLVVGIITFCVASTLRCKYSLNPSFKRNLESYVFLGLLIMWLCILAVFLYTAYIGHIAVNLAAFIGFQFLIIPFALMAIFANIFRITFYDVQIHWRTHLGKKRVYAYNNIKDCFYGYKRGLLFIQIEFEDNKKLDLVATKKLIKILEEKGMVIAEPNSPH